MTDLVTLASKRLEAISPADTEIRLSSSLVTILGDGFNVEKGAVFSDKGFEGASVLYVKRPDGITADQIAQAVTALEYSVVPARAETILEELRRLKIICKSRNEDGEEVANAIPTVVRELQKLPADILMEALSGYFEWLPKVSEIFKIAKPKSDARWKVLNDVKGWEPWTDEEELARLEEQLRLDIHWAKVYKRKDPPRAAKWLAAAKRTEKKLEDMR